MEVMTMLLAQIKLNMMGFAAPLLCTSQRGLQKFHAMAFAALLLCTLPASEGLGLHNQGRTEFPSQEELQPATEAHLNLNNNQLEYIPEGALCHMTALNDLRIQSNQLKTLGNLSCIGESLKYLFISGNPLPSIADDAFEGLVILERLYIYSNQLTAVPSLEHVAGTLKVLNFGSNPLSGNVATDKLASLTSLNDLTMTSIGLKGYPSLPELPELLNLQFGNEDLELGTEDVLDLAGFPKLTHLRLGSSKMTRIPNIDATHQLTEVQINNNKFVLSGPDDFKRFPQTTSINMNNCDLTTFPDFTHIGQTLTTVNFENNPFVVVSKELLGKLPNLVTLNLKNTDVTEVPCMFGTCLYQLQLSSTPITKLPCQTSCSGHTVIDHSELKRIETRHAVSLKGTWRIYVRNVPELEEINDYMDIKQGSSVLTFTGSTNLDLCKCQHTWMKIALDKGANIQVPDKACGNNGEMWSELNSTQLLEQCDDSTLPVQDASSQTVWSIHRPTAASCELPAHAYYDNIRQLQCGRHCLSLAGCTTYKFLKTKGTKGHCQVLVPSAPATTITVPDADNADWKCYAALPGTLQKIMT